MVVDPWLLDPWQAPVLVAQTPVAAVAYSVLDLCRIWMCCKEQTKPHEFATLCIPAMPTRPRSGETWFANRYGREDLPRGWP